VTLLDAIASAAIARNTGFAVQNLANIAWALASRLCKNPPFMEAIASAAISSDNASNFIPGAPNVQSLLWSLWKMERHDLVQTVNKNWL